MENLDDLILPGENVPGLNMEIRRAAAFLEKYFNVNIRLMKKEDLPEEDSVMREFKSFISKDGNAVTVLLDNLGDMFSTRSELIDDMKHSVFLNVLSRRGVNFLDADGYRQFCRLVLGNEYYIDDIRSAMNNLQYAGENDVPANRARALLEQISVYPDARIQYVHRQEAIANAAQCLARIVGAGLKVSPKTLMGGLPDALITGTKAALMQRLDGKAGETSREEVKRRLDNQLRCREEGARSSRNIIVALPNPSYHNRTSNYQVKHSERYVFTSLDFLYYALSRSGIDSTRANITNIAEAMYNPLMIYRYNKSKNTENGNIDVVLPVRDRKTGDYICVNISESRNHKGAKSLHLSNVGVMTRDLAKVWERHLTQSERNLIYVSGKLKPGDLHMHDPRMEQIFFRNRIAQKIFNREMIMINDCDDNPELNHEQLSTSYCSENINDWESKAEKALEQIYSHQPIDPSFLEEIIDNHSKWCDDNDIARDFFEDDKEDDKEIAKGIIQTYFSVGLSSLHYNRPLSSLTAISQNREARDILQANGIKLSDTVEALLMRRDVLSSMPKDVQRKIQESLRRGYIDNESQRSFPGIILDESPCFHESGKEKVCLTPSAVKVLMSLGAKGSEIKDLTTNRIHTFKQLGEYKNVDVIVTSKYGMPVMMSSELGEGMCPLMEYAIDRGADSVNINNINNTYLAIVSSKIEADAERYAQVLEEIKEFAASRETMKRKADKPQAPVRNPRPAMLALQVQSQINLPEELLDEFRDYGIRQTDIDTLSSSGFLELSNVQLYSYPKMAGHQPPVVTVNLQISLSFDGNNPSLKIMSGSHRLFHSMKDTMAYYSKISNGSDIKRTKQEEHSNGNTTSRKYGGRKPR